MTRRLNEAALLLAAGSLLLTSCGKEGTASQDPGGGSSEQTQVEAPAENQKETSDEPAVVFEDAFAFIRLEAEEAETIEGDIMHVVADPGASGGKCIEIPDKAGTCEPQGEQKAKFARAVYRFKVETPGNYTFWCRRKWHDACGDTLAVRFDRAGEPRKLEPPSEYLFGGSDSKPVRWAWSPVYVKGKGKPRQFFLDAGEHVIEIVNREDGPRFDVLLLTNDPDYVPVGME
jgi:hypothetical protein